MQSIFMHQNLVGLALFISLAMIIDHISMHFDTHNLVTTTFSKPEQDQRLETLFHFQKQKEKQRFSTDEQIHSTNNVSRDSEQENGSH